MIADIPGPHSGSGNTGAGHKFEDITDESALNSALRRFRFALERVSEIREQSITNADDECWQPERYLNTLSYQD